MTMIRRKLAIRVGIPLVLIGILVGGGRSLAMYNYAPVLLADSFLITVAEVVLKEVVDQAKAKAYERLWGSVEPARAEVFTDGLYWVENTYSDTYDGPRPLQGDDFGPFADPGLNWPYEGYLQRKLEVHMGHELDGQATGTDATMDFDGNWVHRQLNAVDAQAKLAKQFLTGFTSCYEILHADGSSYGKHCSYGTVPQSPNMDEVREKAGISDLILGSLISTRIERWRCPLFEIRSEFRMGSPPSSLLTMAGDDPEARTFTVTMEAELIRLDYGEYGPKKVGSKWLVLKEFQMDSYQDDKVSYRGLGVNMTFEKPPSASGAVNRYFKKIPLYGPWKYDDILSGSNYENTSPYREVVGEAIVAVHEEL